MGFFRQTKKGKKVLLDRQSYLAGTRTAIKAISCNILEFSHQISMKNIVINVVKTFFWYSMIP